MKSDKLKQFVSLLDGLLKEKAELEARLEEINRALGISSAPSVPGPSGKSTRRPGRPPKSAAATQPEKAPKAARKTRKRAENGASLKETVIGILKQAKSLSRQELLEAVKAGGYKFTATDPLNSLSTLIYSNRKIFNAKSGVISLA